MKTTTLNKTKEWLQERARAIGCEAEVEKMTLDPQFCASIYRNGARGLRSHTVIAYHRSAMEACRQVIAGMTAMLAEAGLNPKRAR